MNKNKKQTIIIFPIIIVVIISILVSIVFVFNNTNTIDYESKLEEAQKYVDEMDYKKAEIAYLEAIEIDSKQAKAYIELADIYELNNQNEKVAEVLNKAKKTVSSNYKKEITNRKDQASNLIINNGGEHVTYNGKTYYWKYSDYSIKNVGGLGIDIDEGIYNVKSKNEKLICEDSTGKQEVLYTGNGLGKIWIGNGRIYLNRKYGPETGNMEIFSMKMDGSNVKNHIKMNGFRIFGIDNDGNIILSNFSKTKIKKVNISTNTVETIKNNATCLYLDGNYIYYSENKSKAISRINTKNKSNISILKFEKNYWIGSFKAINNYFYFSYGKLNNDMYQYAKMRKDGKEFKKIKQGQEPTFVVVSDEKEIILKEGIIKGKIDYEKVEINEGMRDVKYNFYLYDDKGNKIELLNNTEYSTVDGDYFNGGYIIIYEYDGNNFYFTNGFESDDKTLFIFYKKNIKTGSLEELYRIKGDYKWLENTE